MAIRLKNRHALMLSGILTGTMFIVVMFIVNPLIDGKTGMEVLLLQMSFTTDVGNSIIAGWGEVGQQHFLNYIYTDYLYAVSYAFFLSLLYANKLLKRGIKMEGWHVFILILPFIAGVFDMIENTIEIMFLQDSLNFSQLLFGCHSVLATLKWIALPVLLFFLIVPAKSNYFPQRCR